MPLVKKYPPILIAIGLLGIIIFFLRSSFFEILFLAFFLYGITRVFQVKEEGLEIPYRIFQKRLVPWDQIESISCQGWLSYLQINYRWNGKQCKVWIPHQMIKDKDFCTAIFQKSNQPIPDKYLRFHSRWEKLGGTLCRILWTITNLILLGGALWFYQYSLPYGCRLWELVFYLLIAFFLVSFLYLIMEILWAIERKPFITGVLGLSLFFYLFTYFWAIFLFLAPSVLISLITFSILIISLSLSLVAIWGEFITYRNTLIICILLVIPSGLIGIPNYLIPQTPHAIIKTKKYPYMQWTPDNQLMVYSIYSGNSSRHLYLYDPKQNQWSTIPMPDDSQDINTYKKSYWSPDGKYALIQFTQTTQLPNSTNLCLFNKSLHTTVSIKKMDLPPSYNSTSIFAWCPDSKKLIYAEPIYTNASTICCNCSSYRLMVYYPETNSHQELFQTPLVPHADFWKDTSTWILATIPPNNQGVFKSLSFWKYDLPTSGKINSHSIKPELLYARGNPWLYFTIAPNKKFVLFHTEPAYNGYLDLESRQIHTIPKEFQSDRVCIHPRENKYAFIKENKHHSEIREVSLKDFSCHTIFTENHPITSIEYSPDGTKIAYSTKDNAVAMVDINGTNWKLVHSVNLLDEYFKWSPDSNEIAMSINYFLNNKSYVYLAFTGNQQKAPQIPPLPDK